MNSHTEFISNRVVTGSRHRSLVTWRQPDLVSASDSCPVMIAVSTDKHPCASNGRASSEGLKVHLSYYTLKDVGNEIRHKKKRAWKRILKSKESAEIETKNETQTQLGIKFQSKMYWRHPFDQTVRNGRHSFLKKKYASFLVIITLYGDMRFYIQKN